MNTHPNLSKFGALLPVIFFAFAGSGSSAFAQAATTMNFGPAIEEADAHRAQLRVDLAEAAYQRAFASSPNDPTVLVRYASFKRTLGEYQESIALLRRAEESIANGAVLIGGPEYLQLTKGITYYRTGIDNAAAVAIFKKFIEEYPDAAAYRLHLAYAEIGAGNDGEGLSNLQMAEGLFGTHLNSYRAATLALGYAKIGRREDVMRLFAQMQQMEEVSQAGWAAIYIALGDHNQALPHLESAIAEPEDISGATNVLYFLADNVFADPVLETPQFQALFAKLRGK